MPVAPKIISAGEPRLFMLAAPMAWGKDTVLDKLKTRYGWRYDGEYMPITPGQVYRKKGSKNEGLPIDAKPNPLIRVGESRLVIVGRRGDDWQKAGLPDALTDTYLRLLDAGDYPLSQCRTMGAHLSPCYQRLLMEKIGSGRIVWLYSTTDYDVRQAAEKMMKRGNRSPEKCLELCRSEKSGWTRAVALIKEMIADGAEGTGLPVGDRYEQYIAVEDALKKYRALGEPLEKPVFPDGPVRSVKTVKSRSESASQKKQGHRITPAAPRPTSGRPKGLLGGVSASPGVRKDPQRPAREKLDKIAISMAVPDDIPDPMTGEGSGAYMRRTWLLGRYSPEQVLTMVRSAFPNTKAGMSRVRRNIKKTGVTR